MTKTTYKFIASDLWIEQESNVYFDDNYEGRSGLEIATIHLNKKEIKKLINYIKEHDKTRQKISSTQRH